MSSDSVRATINHESRTIVLDGVTFQNYSALQPQPNTTEKVISWIRTLAWGKQQEEVNKLLKGMGSDIDQLFNSCVFCLPTTYMGCYPPNALNLLKTETREVAIPCDSSLYDTLHRQPQRELCSKDGVIQEAPTLCWRGLFKGNAFKEAFQLYAGQCNKYGLNLISHMVQPWCQEDPQYSPFFQKLVKDVETTRKNALRALLTATCPLPIGVTTMIYDYDSLLSPASVTISSAWLQATISSDYFDNEGTNLVMNVCVRIL